MPYSAVCVHSYFPPKSLVCTHLPVFASLINNIFDQFQSGFCHQHSAEIALLRVTNDNLMDADKGEHCILVLLDLSSGLTSLITPLHLTDF